MAAPSAGPCTPWLEADDVLTCGPCASVVEADDSLASAVAEGATDFLYEATGRRFPGICTKTVRPCHQRGGCDCGALACGCRGVDRVRLPGSPVVSVESVVVDGNTLDPSEYDVLDFLWLVRLSPDGVTPPTPWPCCQRLDRPSTAERTWEVEFSFGIEVPMLGFLASQALACDWYMGCTGGDCTTPSPRVTSRTTQGTTLQFIAPRDYGVDATGLIKTGLPVVDAFLSLYGKRRRRAFIASPDVGVPAHRFTGTTNP